MPTKVSRACIWRACEAAGCWAHPSQGSWLWCVPLPARHCCNPGAPGRPDCPTGRQPSLQLPFSFFPKVTTSKSPPSAPSASTRRYGGVPTGRVLAGELPSHAQTSPAPRQRARRLALSMAASWGAEPSAEPHAIEISDSSSAAPHRPAAFSVTNYETSGVNQHRAELSAGRERARAGPTPAAPRSAEPGMSAPHPISLPLFCPFSLLEAHDVPRWVGDRGPRAGQHLGAELA